METTETGKLRPEMRVIAALLFVIAVPTAMPAAGHVIMREDLFGLKPPDHLPQPDPARIDEVLPVKHQCSEVPVLIHAQQRTMERMIESCETLKWTEDRFHALLQTGARNLAVPEEPFREAHVATNMYLFDDLETQTKYLKEFWDIDLGPAAGVYFAGTIVLHKGPTPRFTSGTELHEYTHHLDYLYIDGYGAAPFYPLWVEGLATFMEGEYGRYHVGDWYVYGGVTSGARVIGKALPHGLPRLTELLYRDTDAWHDLMDKLGFIEVRYNWGSLAIRFLVERHHGALLDLKEIFGSRPRLTDHRLLREYEWWDDFFAQVNGVIAPLDDDWLNWLGEYVALTAHAPGPIIAIVGDEHYRGLEHTRSEDGLRLRLSATAWVYLGEFFRTVKDLAFDLSSPTQEAKDGSPSTAPQIQIYAVDKQMRIRASSAGTWRFTITASTTDGESAELPFTVTVVERLVSSDIVLRDALSLDEGQAVVNLTHYFGGPKDISFAAESGNDEVATVAVTIGGKLVVTAVSPGEAEITVRAASLGQDVGQTFTIVVNDECPSWLCERGFFSGWRKLLLEPPP